MFFFFFFFFAAGNPSEYNKSVRDFDVVTMDRIRYIHVETDYYVWKEYAISKHIHPMILSYLELKPNHFYTVSTSVDGMEFVTARGWEDLSYLLYSYEMMQLEISQDTFMNICIMKILPKMFSPIIWCIKNIRMIMALMIS